MPSSKHRGISALERLEHSDENDAKNVNGYVWDGTNWVRDTGNSPDNTASGTISTQNLNPSSGTLSVTAAAMFYSGGSTIGAGSTVTTLTDFLVADVTNSGTLTNHTGLSIPALTAATNNTAIVIGTATTGNWGIYQSTTTDNYFAGDIQIADGSAASPSLTFGSDTDTGIHRVGANQMSFDTNGLARLQISATSTVVNPANLASGDFQVHGDTLNNLIQTDASADALGFFNATPIARPTTAYAAATFTANTSGIANDTATFDGYTIGQVVKALRDMGILT